MVSIDVEWEVPVSVYIINTPAKYYLVDAVSIYGFNAVYTRSRFSSRESRQNVVDVKGEFEFDNRNGLGDFQSKVTEILIPSLEIELSLTEKLGDDEFNDTEETIKTEEIFLDVSTFQDLEQFSRMPDLNVTELNLSIDYVTKEVRIYRERGGIEWGQYYE